MVKSLKKKQAKEEILQNQEILENAEIGLETEEIDLESKLKAYEQAARAIKSKNSGKGKVVNAKNKKKSKKSKNKKFKDKLINIGLKKTIKKSKVSDINFADDSSDDEDLLNLTKGLKKKTNIFKEFKKEEDFSIDVAAVQKMMQGGGMFAEDDDLEGGMGLEQPKKAKKGKGKLRV